MLDFLELVETEKASRGATLYFVKPDFVHVDTKDLMIRGGDFYAVWDDDAQMWSTRELDLINMVDCELTKHCNEDQEKHMVPLLMRNASSGSMNLWIAYSRKQARDNFHTLDSKIIFANTKTKKEDYATKRVPYSLEKGECPAYDEMMSVLYSPEERQKLEWAIGAVLSGDSKKIQKFIVLYGAPGSGKSTFLHIVEKLFEGYTCSFDSKSLVGNSDFALEDFKNNPLVAIQHDGDLSKIESNTILNSLVSHETMSVNIKHANKFPMTFQTFLFLGTNKPVKITDAKSGILRRLIDVSPSGNKIETKRFRELERQIEFELGQIASHCLELYKHMGANYYDAYTPTSMIAATNDFYDFVEYYYFDFAESDYILLKDAWLLYKTYCEMANVPYPYSRRVMMTEFAEYFSEHYDEYRDPKTGKHLRNVFVGFKKKKFNKNYIPVKQASDDVDSWIKLTSKSSIFDVVCGDCKAQLTNTEGNPRLKWDNVTTKLMDIDTRQLHFVKVPTNHIVVDFDLKDETGNKSYKLNLEAASKWPETYAEISKSGAGIHLHYIYTGDPTMLDSRIDDHIEVKVFSGGSSLRRKLTRCNDIPISKISSGLPLKKEKKKMLDEDWYKNERKLKKFIGNCIQKQHHGYTKPEIDYIYDTLEKCYNEPGFTYDVRSLHPYVREFAASSNNNAEKCLEIVAKMKFASKDVEEREAEEARMEMKEKEESKPIAFYDVEVFPNLLLINWKVTGGPAVCNRMINPSPNAVSDLVTGFRLVGFNNRRYDNHILYARMMGYDNQQIYELSSRLVSSSKDVSNAAMFRAAMNLSYTDIYDYLSTKQSLKKWEIKLGLHHLELGLDWNKPVPEEQWEEVAIYCDNDVLSTEALFYSKDGQEDFLARQIIAELSGLTVNTPTNKHSERIIFGTNKHPQDEFVYFDLRQEFPTYTFDFSEDEVEGANGKKTKVKKKVSKCLGVVANEGGYVKARPGMYGKVVCFDIASMHPSSAIAMNVFGDRYTKVFADLVKLRKLLKHGKMEEASRMFDGKVAKYLNDPAMCKGLSKALKIVINSIYGLTSATFDNPFRDPRNVDNIVAKRGALFMITLDHELAKRGIESVHIKTDSIKVEDPSQETIDFIMEFGKKYGYDFEVEHVYSKFCLVNDAVYIAYEENDQKWEATGAQFKQDYVFKKLFSHEDIEFQDMCEIKAVKSAISLDLNEDDPEQHNYNFIGKTGEFCPIKPGCGGGLMVVEREDKKNGGVKYDAVTGTKNYRWLEAEYVKNNHLENCIDTSYYDALCEEAWSTLEKYGDPELFINNF